MTWIDLEIFMSEDMQEDTVEAGPKGEISDPVPSLGNVVQLCDVLEIFVDYLREVYIASLKDEYEIQWPNDLRLQPYRNFHACRYEAHYDTGICKFLSKAEVDWDARNTALSALILLNSLNRHGHAIARRVMGHKLTLNLPFSPSHPFKSFTNGFDLLDDYTRVISIVEKAPSFYKGYDKPFWSKLVACRNNFLQVFTQKVTSLRVLQVTSSNLGDLKNMVKAMLECSPVLEELCLTNHDWSFTGLDVTKHFFNSDSDISKGWNRSNCSSLRIIRLENFAILQPRQVDRGLPCELSSVLNFTSVTSLQVYTPYRGVNSKEHGLELSTSCRKLSWRREADKDFTLDSIWLHDIPTNTTISEDEFELLKNTPHVTLEVPYLSAPEVVPVVASIWRSSQSLTILTDDFPTNDFFRHIPSALDLLIITFMAHFCRSDPAFLDRRLCGCLESRAIKNVRLCIGTHLRCPGEGFTYQNTGLPFTRQDSSLFVKSRALCMQRGGQFILENLWSAPEEN